MRKELEKKSEKERKRDGKRQRDRKGQKKRQSIIIYDDIYENGFCINLSIRLAKQIKFELYAY